MALGRGRPRRWAEGRAARIRWTLVSFRSGSVLHPGQEARQMRSDADRPMPAVVCGFVYL